MGGNKKFRALRLKEGNFGWASEGIARQTRIVDATPFRQFYENHYSKALGRKANWEPTEEEKAAISRAENCGKETAKKYADRSKKSAVDADLNNQFLQGKLLAKISSRPGQSGRADGYILEGKELEFYSKKLKTKGGKK